MTITLAPYGTLINHPKLSKTAGKWAWAVAPGAHSRADSRVSVGGWTLGVPTASKNKDRAFEFIQFACSKEWMRRSVLRGNAPPRVSVLKHPDVMRDYGGHGAGRGDADRNAGAARCDRAHDGTVAAHCNLLRAVRAEHGKAGAGCGRVRLAARSAAGRVEGLTPHPYSRSDE
jgi:hypothetical protein